MGREVKSEYRTLFLEESQDQIQEWEESLLNLEKNPSDRELIDSLFRSIHTLKGSAGFVGFEDLQKITHDLESSLQDVRDGNKELTQEMTEVLFEGLDLCRQMIEAFSEDLPFKGNTSSLFDKLQKIQGSPENLGVKEEEESNKNSSDKDINGEKNTQAIETDSEPDSRDISGEKKIYRIDLEIKAGKKEAYLRALLVQSKLEEAGKIITTKPPLEEVRLIDDDFKFQIVLETQREAEELRKAANIDLVKVSGVQEQKKEEDVADNASPEKEKKYEPQKELLSRSAKTEEVVRVPVEKLDVILNLVGELVVQNSGFVSTTDDLRDLQDAVMKVRMLPIAVVFNRFNRVVRDLSKDRGKEIKLEIYGEETEIDKKVTDHIGEPLVHLVRNAVDHGIESKEERAASGKSTIGHIRLGAYQEGDHICIEVSDDGKGLDKEKIVRKALEKEILKEEDVKNMSEEEIYGLVFLPGFSTAKEITDISGRGVGLDVVKRAVDDMGGSLLIKSQKTKGTTITITLPLTMAIITAILVETVVRLREEVLPVIHLNELLDLPEDDSSSGPAEDKSIPIVIVVYQGKKIGIAVERLLGNSEIVIKSLSKHYQEIEGFTGASIMGDGSIALILDTTAIIRNYSLKKENEDILSSGEDLIIATRNSVEKKDKSIIDDKIAGEEEKIEQDRENSANRMDQLDESVPFDKPDPENGKVNVQTEELFILQATEKQKDIFEDIHNAGAINASISLSSLTNRDVRVSFPETRIVPLGDVAAELGGEENPVGGIYIGIKGDVTGGILIVMPVDNLLQLCDLLFHRESGATKKIGETEYSGILEMGNILSASFINAMADTTRLSVLSSVPDMRVDMCLSVIDSILAHFNQPGNHILITEAEIFFSDTDQAVCNMLLFLEEESFKKMMGELSGNTIEHAGG